MPRGTKISIDDRITKQESLVEKAKEKYDKEQEKLKELYTIRRQEQQKDLLEAIENSGKSTEEIIQFLND